MNKMVPVESYAELLKVPGIKRTFESSHLDIWKHVADANAFDESKFIVIYNQKDLPMQVIWATVYSSHYELAYRRKLKPEWLKPLRQYGAKLLKCRQKDIVFLDDRIDPTEENSSTFPSFPHW